MSFYNLVKASLRCSLARLCLLGLLINRLFHPLQQPDNGIPHNAKLGHIGGADGFLGLRFDGEGVDGLAVLVDAEIQVGTGGKPGAADVTDDLFLFYLRADFDAFSEA